MTDQQPERPERAAAFLDRWGAIAISGAGLFAVFAALFILTSDIDSRRGSAAPARQAPVPLAALADGARGAADGILLERVARAGALSAEVTALRQDIRRIERTLRALNLKLVAARLQSAGSQTTLASRAKRIAELAKQLAAARAEIADLRQETVSRQAEIVALRKTVAALRKDVSALRRAQAGPPRDPKKKPSATDE